MRGLPGRSLPVSISTARPEFGEPNPVSDQDQDLNGRLRDIVDVLTRRGVGLVQARQEFERQFILASLRHNDGNLGRSAQALGIHRNTLRNKVSNLGIDLKELPIRRGK